MINQSRILLIIIIFFTGFVSVIAQTTIAFQGFEGTGADNWGFTPPTQNTAVPMTPVGANNYGAAYAASGTRSMRFGGGSTTCGSGSGNCIAGSSSGGSCNNNNNGQQVEFSTIDITCFTGVKVSVAFRTHTACSANSGEGFDNTESVFFETRLNGGAWTTVATAAGSNDCTWTYATNPVVCGANTPVANPYVYNLPVGTQSVAFRVRLDRNRSNEVLYIDNISLTGIGTSITPISIQHINP